MNRITQKLNSRCRHKLLAPFFTVGYPDLKSSLDLVRVGIDAGADFVELGMPFSDPMADGPDIQLSSQVALKWGTTFRDVFGVVRSVRKFSDIPLLLMGYYNPVLAYGDDCFTREAKQSGVDGLIIPDLPVDEAGELHAAARREDLSMVFLVAPTTSTERLRLIDHACTDFVYAVTVTGVTGGRSGFERGTGAYLKGLTKRLTKPFVAGFGVSSPETAGHLAQYADGVVIGSALIRKYRSARNRLAGLQAVGRLLASIRRSLD